jgi:hypothetical protein
MKELPKLGQPLKFNPDYTLKDLEHYLKRLFARSDPEIKIIRRDLTFEKAKKPGS